MADAGSNKRITVASMFAGAGGLDLGFQGGFKFLGNNYAHTGMDIIWANEISKAACRTYELNIGPVVCADIRDVIHEVPQADILIGGFPCQDISINGKMRGLDGDRSWLYRYMVDVVRRTHPKVFVAENVGSLLLQRHTDTLSTILREFLATGYDVTWQVYHAEDYGVPQRRARVLIVGTRDDVRSYHAPAQVTTEKPVTAYAALHDLEKLQEDKGFAHTWSRAKPSKDQGSRKLSADKPGYTIRAECHGNNAWHYSLPRRISMREAARLQSFPDEFIFPCGLRETERQIGNAVPPVLAWHVAQAVAGTLND